MTDKSEANESLSNPSDSHLQREESINSALIV